MFRGTFTALVTPFRNGSIDVSAFQTLIETQIAAGISGVVAIGTTGESPTLSHDEHEQLIRLTVATVSRISCSCSSCESVGDSPVVPIATTPEIPAAICVSISVWKAETSILPLRKGVTSAVNVPRNIWKS